MMCSHSVDRLDLAGTSLPVTETSEDGSSVSMRLGTVTQYCTKVKQGNPGFSVGSNVGDLDKIMHYRSNQILKEFILGMDL